jgi:Flp pilus assembly protein TadG
MRNNSGQGLVEFAIVIVLLFTVIFGALMIGQIFHAKVVLNNAAREGARYLSLHPTDNGNAYSGTIAATLQEAQNSGVVITSSDVTVPSCNVDEISGYCESGFPVQVRASTTFTMAWDWLFPSSILIDGAARMMVP